MSASGRLFTSCIALSMLIAAKTARADLEVGTAFGANWRQVEDHLRSDFLSSFAEVRSICSAEAKCPSGIQRLCGYANNEQLDGAAPPLQYSKRHKFDKACSFFPGAEHGCYLELCLKQCFERTETDMTKTSKRCQKSLLESQKKYQILQQEETSNDEGEKIFIRYILAMIVLSMVASLLLIFIVKSWPDDRNTRMSEKCCLLLNLTSVAVLLSVVILVNPAFIVVLVPPFALVQAVYYALFHTSTTTPPSPPVIEHVYFPVRDAENMVQPNAHIGIPIQIV
mmetsp:Transcript_46425/g.68591  ORF Transcript_46425/g.68591 Transcript_46425/m.68591 type:complete len:282 (-) Transcript_46425:66-911(-)|eukprot:CAMPEP_0195519012 /NCGR_PEP_ID=MMETSP0794_2-20130614/14178_1 /TAXON_ID=515487 /ORGANISM="Stephanopyxis turris, Strain CCMP 815" /LENGTH=281 /DNA_ID=CAMNT_0040648081 /DNA_START=117 /DNA_END=962 /DNA_ORIENTATION=-